MPINPLNALENKPTRSQKSLQIENDFYLHYRHDLPGKLEAPQGFTHHLITFFRFYRTYDVKLTGKSQVKKHLLLKLSKFLKP